MGNRAVITTKEDYENNGIGIYMHFNGGRDSIEAFLAYCKAKKFRSPEEDCYGYAYLTAVIANFFGDGLSVGIEKISCLDTNNGDNGVYIIEKWNIVDRIYNPSIEQNKHDFEEMLTAINNAQPKKMQLTKEEISKLAFFYQKKQEINQSEHRL